MNRTTGRAQTARGLGGALLLAALASNGCLYVNIERGGPRPGHVQVSTLAPGSLSETVGTDFLTTWQAAHAALWDLNLNIVSESRTTDSGHIECATNSNERVRVELEGAKPGQTAVGVRWMTLEDRGVSRQILERINTRVTAATLPAQPMQPAGTPVAIAPPAAP